MAETKQEKLVAILKELRKIGDIQGSSVVSRDGLIIAADLSQDVDEETFAAMSAAMQGAAETAISELKQGGLNQIIIDASKGKMITIGAGTLAILVVLAKPEVNLGLILLEMKKTSSKIASTVGG
jgi:hypothetical protein